MRLIGLSGYAGVGKDEVGHTLVMYHEFERRAFADALKAILYDLDSVVASFVDGLGWDDAKRADEEIRAKLQRLGVACRTHIAGDVWVDACLGGLDPNGSYVVTDVRFPNEAQRIVDLGGEVWRVTRPGVGPVNGHVSESAMDDWAYDMTLENRGTRRELRLAIDGVMSSLRWVPRERSDSS